MKLEDIDYFAAKKKLQPSVFTLAQKVYDACKKDAANDAEMQRRLTLLSRSNGAEHLRQCGDYIIADNSSFNPKTGDYVVSLIDGMANIKKFVLDRVNQQIVLMSESSEDFPPIFIHPDDTIDYVVQARVVQVVKTPKLA